jgi:hypothetical protein
MALSNLRAGVSTQDVSIRFRAYGRDAVLGAVEPDLTIAPHEVGVMIEVIAPSQELANTVLALVRSSALHCPFEGRKTTAGNLAFPFSPSDLVGGPVYEFSVYHLLETPDPGALFPIEQIHIGS